MVWRVEVVGIWIVVATSIDGTCEVDNFDEGF